MAPWVYPRRATRLGGSSSSARARCGAKRTAISKRLNKPKTFNEFLSIFCLLFDLFYVTRGVLSAYPNCYKPRVSTVGAQTGQNGTPSTGSSIRLSFVSHLGKRPKGSLCSI